MNLRPAYQLLLLLVVTLGVYYPTLSAPFNSLDDEILVNLLLNQEGFSLTRHFSPGGTYDYYRPLLTLTFEIDKHLGGLQEAFMHLVNVLLHATNVALVWLFARRFGRFIELPGELLPFVAALLFALHPINTEPVNWITARTDLLAGTFVLIALICLLHSVMERSLLWGAAGAMAILFGSLCKETALFLIPGACWLLLCRPPTGASSWRWRWLLPAFYGIVVGTYFLLRWGAFQTDRGLNHTVRLVAHAAGMAVTKSTPAALVDPFPWLDAIRVVIKTSGFYAVKLFQPLPLNFAIHRLDDLYVLPGVILVAFLAFLAWRRRPVGWLFLTSASIAVSALFVVFTRLAWTPLAERYLYIPSAPFAVALVYAVAGQVRPGWRARIAVMVIPLLAAGACWATTERNLVWQDNLTLYEDAVSQSPDFAPARNQLALALIARHRQEEARAIMVENVMPAKNMGEFNRAAAYWQEGDYSSARADLQGRLQTSGSQEIKVLEMLVQMTAAQALKSGDEREQRAYYTDILLWLERLARLSPNGMVYYRIGRFHLLLDNRDQAGKAFAEAARRLHPNSPYREPAAKLAGKLGS